MAARDIIVVGASSGGVEALCRLARQLPRDFSASIFVVMHVGSSSHLSGILARCGHLPATEPADGERFVRGHIYVAPSDRHLLLDDHHIRLSRAARENRHRPAIDPLFRSAARAFRERVIGVILTGSLDDGSAGLFAIKSRGGIAIVQDPNEAVEPGMPRSALRNVEVDYCLPLDEIAATLIRLVGTPVGKQLPTDAPAASERSIQMAPGEKPGFREDAVSFVCPECNGPLYERREGRLVKFNCQIGHTFSPESLTAAHTDALERALWIAVRTLNERVAIHEALAEQQRASGGDDLAGRLKETASSAADDVKLLQEILERL